jgi:hypothetical protein
MNNSPQFVMARIDLPILLRNDGSYDAMNERAKVSFFNIETLPEINTKTQISLGDLFSQMGETQPQHSNRKTEERETRIRIDGDTTPTPMDLSWFRPVEHANTNAVSNGYEDEDADVDVDADDGSHSDMYENKDDNTAIIGGSSPSINENHINNTSPEQPEKTLNSDDYSVSTSDNEPEHEIPVMRIMRTEIKQRKAPTQGKTFKKYEKGVRNFTQKKYSS